jgi:SnoaL-like domain
VGAASEGLRRWHEVFLSGDPAPLGDLLAEDAVFRSPAVYAPQVGRRIVSSYLGAAMAVLAPTLRYVDEYVRDDDAVLEFTATVDGLHVHGIDQIVWNPGGEIVSFTVMVRPLRGLNRLVERMGAELSRET